MDPRAHLRAREDDKQEAGGEQRVARNARGGSSLGAASLPGVRHVGHTFGARRTFGGTGTTGPGAPSDPRQKVYAPRPGTVGAPLTMYRYVPAGNPAYLTLPCALGCSVPCLARTRRPWCSWSSTTSTSSDAPSPSAPTRVGAGHSPLYFRRAGSAVALRNVPRRCGAVITPCRLTSAGCTLPLCKLRARPHRLQRLLLVKRITRQRAAPREPTVREQCGLDGDRGRLDRFVRHTDRAELADA
jgi:hypothetical protein